MDNTSNKYNHEKIKNIIIIANHTSLKTRMDKLDYNFFCYLVQNSKYNVILMEPTDEDKIIQFKNHSDTILIIFTCMPIFLKDYTNIIIYYIYDFVCTCNDSCNSTNNKCKFQEQKKYIYNEKNVIKYIWYKYYTHITQQLINENKIKCFKFPHMMFDPNIHKNYNLPKIYDIVIYGSTTPNIYPFRNRLLHLLEKNSHIFNTHIIRYSKKKTIPSGFDLYKIINQSWLCIATTNINNSLLAKYFEIVLSGSVVCGDYPSLEDERFLENNMIQINNNMSDDDIITIIKNALNDKQKLKNISQKTMKYFSENYMMKNGLNTFETLVQNCS